MCGIYGRVADVPPAELRSGAERAMSALAHRGPDGHHCILHSGLVLAHRRLAIFDVSDKGRQPMTGWGRTLVFNGAIYNFRELRQELRPFGYTFTTETDTELILAAYDRWGRACFERFVGMWALAIYTPDSGELLLCRDRFGIKPLYFTEERGFAFSSETSALCMALHLRPRPNVTLAAEFIRHGWQDHRRESFHEGINQLAAGHWMEVDTTNGKVLKTQQYYDPAARVAATEVPGNRKTATGRLRELLNESVTLRTRSDVGCSLTLSGGIDSSSIAGVIGAGMSLRPPTFSALFPGTPYDESPFVNAVNKRWGLPGHGYLPSYEDFLRDAEACQLRQGQPLSSMAVVTHYSLMRRIRDAGQRVILNGQGADEILAGYDKFYLSHLRELLGRGRRYEAIRSVWHYVRLHRLDPTKLRAKLQKGSSGAEEMLGEYFATAGAEFRRGPEADVLTTSLQLIGGVGLPVLLRHEDRNTMAFGLESRVSFLDHRLVEYALALPAEWKIRRGVRKAILREACSDVLPPIVRDRYDKLGFATPQMEWMEADAERYLDAVRRGERQAYFSNAARLRCERAMRQRRRSDYGFVFRCWAWMNFVDTFE